MSDKTYRLIVADDEKTYAALDGDVSLIAYAVRQLDLTDAATYDVKLTQTDGIAGRHGRTVVALTADGGTVNFLLGSKIRKERKASDSVDDTSEDKAPAEVDQPAEVQDSVFA